MDRKDLIKEDVPPKWNSSDQLKKRPRGRFSLLIGLERISTKYYCSGAQRDLFQKYLITMLTPLPSHCPRCKTALPNTAPFCGECKLDLRHENPD
ncbi:hypothetical protein [Herbaspirillum rubrisubalbicans]|nr:hypothetical protein [Herbaspirillum rubrisubalbicans]